MKITNDDMKVLLKAQQGELDAVLMYKALAKKVKRTKDAETFNRLAQEEGHHAAVFKNLTNCEGRICSSREISSCCGKISRD